MLADLNTRELHKTKRCRVLTRLGKRIIGSRSSAGQGGFTMVELMVVITIMAVIIGVGAMELTASRNKSFMDNGSLQVEKAIKEAYSIAQNERVSVTCNLYAYNNNDLNKRNCYEILRGEPGSAVSMQPPLGVKATKVGSGGTANYYCNLLDGAQPHISADVTVFFKTRGSETRCEDPASGTEVSRTVTLTFPGMANRNVTVNSQGEVTP